MFYLNRYGKSESGIAVVEFSMLAPVFVFMLVATIDVGMYIIERMKLQNSVQMAANYVAQTADDANVQYVFEEGYQGKGTGIVISSEFSCECSDGVEQECPLTCSSDDYQRRHIKVTATGTFDPFFPYPGVSDGISMQRMARVRVD